MNKYFKLIILFLFITFPLGVLADEKIKIGLLIPLTGDNKNLGQLIVKSTRMALEDIQNDNIEIYPRDTASDPNITLQSANELKNIGVKIIIGPIYFNNTIYLNEIKDVTFLSLTNKTLNLPENIISTGVNSTSQLNTIKKFIESNGIKKTIFLTPSLDYENEIDKGIKESKIKILKHYVYDSEPTKLTNQIEKITDYKIRKQNLADEIIRVENSDLPDKKKKN